MNHSHQSNGWNVIHRNVRKQLSPLRINSIIKAKTQIVHGCWIHHVRLPPFVVVRSARQRILVGIRLLCRWYQSFVRHGCKNAYGTIRITLGMDNTVEEMYSIAGQIKQILTQPPVWQQFQDYMKSKQKNADE